MARRQMIVLVSKMSASRRCSIGGGLCKGFSLKSAVAVGKQPNAA